MNEAQAKGFVRDLAAVCRAHNVTLGSCGCCESISGISWDADNDHQPDVYRYLRIEPGNTRIDIPVKQENGHIDWKQIQVEP